MKYNLVFWLIFYTLQNLSPPWVEKVAALSKVESCVTKQQLCSLKWSVKPLKESVIQKPHSLLITSAGRCWREWPPRAWPAVGQDSQQHPQRNSLHQHWGEQTERSSQLPGFWTVRDFVEPTSGHLPDFLTLTWDSCFYGPSTRWDILE